MTPPARAYQHPVPEAPPSPSLGASRQRFRAVVYYGSMADWEPWMPAFRDMAFDVLLKKPEPNFSHCDADLVIWDVADTSAELIEIGLQIDCRTRNIPLFYLNQVRATAPNMDLSRFLDEIGPFVEEAQARWLQNYLSTTQRISDASLEACSRLAEQTHEPLDKVLFRRASLPRKDLEVLLCTYHGVRQAAIPHKIPAKVLAPYAESWMRRYRFIPFAVDPGRVHIAFADPSNPVTLARVQQFQKEKIVRYWIHPMDLDRLILDPRGHGNGKAPSSGDHPPLSVIPAGDHRSASPEYESTLEIERFESAADISPTRVDGEESESAVQLVERMISRAVNTGASDIHVEPQEKEVFIRLRVDGLLHEAFHIPRVLHGSLLSRIKIMASLDISEKRLPQDGQFLAETSKGAVKFRVSTMPSQYGEKAVIRVLDSRHATLSFSEMQMPEDIRTRFEKELAQINGLILVTGPTGSGKSTTLGAAVRFLHSPSLNIMTLEDPVEHKLISDPARPSGITQSEINPKINLSFADLLRASLRQDPDVVLVGEIRDRETAEISIQAGLMGHLVLSTLHTNNAPTTITRLINIGVEPFLITASLRASLAQRLLRVLCKECRKPEVATPEVCQSLKMPEGSTFHKAVGCKSCGKTGFKGRMAVYELMVMTDEIAALTMKRAEGSILMAAARASGMKTLFDHGLQAALDGKTSLEEVLRVLPPNV